MSPDEPTGLYEPRNDAERAARDSMAELLADPRLSQRARRAIASGMVTDPDEDTASGQYLAIWAWRKDNPWHTTEEHLTRFPEPVALFDKEQAYRKLWHDEPELVGNHGYCATFCTVDGPTYGMSVKDHGVKCESRPGAAVDVVAEDGMPGMVAVYAVKPFGNGLYRPENNPHHEGPWVEISVSRDDQDPETWGPTYTMTSGDARTLAASLLLAADVIEQQEHPIRLHAEAERVRLYGDGRQVPASEDA